MKVKRASKGTVLFGSIFMLFGIIAIIVGINLFIDDKEFEKTAETTNAVITDIDTYRTRRNGKTRTSHTVYIEYTVDGEKYESTLGYYNSSLHKGKVVTILYNPENPADCRSNTSAMELVFISAIGVIFMGVGVLIIVMFNKKSVGRLTVKKSGEKLTGTITDIVTDTSIRVNGQCGCKAEVEVIDSSGCKYLFSSETVMNDPNELMSYVGGTVDVYVDPTDKGKNFVDLESARRAEGVVQETYDFR